MLCEGISVIIVHRLRSDILIYTSYLTGSVIQQYNIKQHPDPACGKTRSSSNLCLVTLLFNFRVHLTCRPIILVCIILAVATRNLVDVLHILIISLRNATDSLFLFLIKLFTNHKINILIYIPLSKLILLLLKNLKNLKKI